MNEITVFRKGQKDEPTMYNVLSELWEREDHVLVFPKLLFSNPYQIVDLFSFVWRRSGVLRDRIRFHLFQIKFDPFGVDIDVLLSHLICTVFQGFQVVVFLSRATGKETVLTLIVNAVSYYSGIKFHDNNNFYWNLKRELERLTGCHWYIDSNAIMETGGIGVQNYNNLHG